MSGPFWKALRAVAFATALGPTLVLVGSVLGITPAVLQAVWESMMRLDVALRILKEHREEIAAFGVTELSIFGSVARGEAGPQSDVDVLVQFGESVGFFEFVRLKNYLERILGRRVDLATVGALRAKMRERVLREAVRAA